ncbi:SGNH/GDSL hydrolase family protein [Lactiplantibacillus sp. WILCCON 0030]|uniref:SGNH/GDSL hydrolase family protein n=1 Tax=Lactiplantibacillus brownii TaxID=3069269 RepID=A0ABU1A9Z5_9LACO|nr:SGNH/GDSL hydrolase family protein [Lactiplantibacillus brownii]MDQ7937425.1 SGNH/GDSL hydrolase family protein [Lactiplantibacillus brownii]
MRKVWEVVKIVIVLAIVGGGAYFGLNLVLHPTSSNSTAVTTKKTTTKTKKTVAKPNTVAHKKKVSLVAVGDSLTEGVGDEAEGGYVGQIKQLLTKKQDLTVTTTNAGKSGDRSDQILARINKSKALQAKITAADVLTVTVGGNDLLQTLEGSITSNNTTKNDATVTRAQNAYAQKLTKLFDKLRSLNPNASLFVFSIYNPIYVNFPNVTAITQYVSQWNHQTETTLASYKRAYFMDIDTVMSHGQYKSASQITKLKQASTSTDLTKITSSKELGTALTAKSKDNDLISNNDNFHPNKRGYHIFATKLYQTMLAHDAWLIKK